MEAAFGTDPQLSLYGSYTENFGASNTRCFGIPLPPQTAQQWETGIKTELLGGRLSACIAHFGLTKQHVPVSARPGVTETAGYTIVNLMGKPVLEIRGYPSNGPAKHR